MFGTLFFLCIGHALADYPLQGDWLSKAKNPTLSPIPGERIWPLALLCHALIHALFVWLFTASMILALCELVAHAAIDYWRCRGGLTYNGDQVLHLLCKVLWAASVTFWLP